MLQQERVRTEMTPYNRTNLHQVSHVWQLHHRLHVVEGELRAYRYGFWLLLGLLFGVVVVILFWQ